MSNKRWTVLVMAFLAPFALLFSVQTAPPLIPAIMTGFALSHGEAAGTMMFVALPAVLLSIPGGFLADRYGTKRLAVVGLVLVCLGDLITALAPSIGILQVGRAIVGIGGALLFTATPALISQWFSGKELGLAMGVWALNMPLATVVSFNLLGRVELAYGWRSGFWIATILTAVVVVFFTLLTEERRTSRAGFSLAALRKGNMWLLASIWGTFNMAVISLTTWGKTLFIDFKDIPPVQADFLASMVMLMAFATPLTGYLAGRLGRRRPLILLGMLGVMVSAALVPSAGGVVLVALLVVLGLFAALPPPSVFALPPELIGHENAGLGFGVLNTGLNGGVVLGPLLVGWALDMIHSELMAFSLMALFAAIATLLSCLLKAR